MNRIKDLREDNDLTLEELGNMIGAAKSTVSKYEREKLSLSPELIDKLCTIFKVSADYLLCRSNNNTKKKPPASEDDERQALANASDETKLALELLNRLTPENRAKAMDHLDYLLDRQEGSEDKK